MGASAGLARGLTRGSAPLAAGSLPCEERLGQELLSRRVQDRLQLAVDA